MLQTRYIQHAHVVRHPLLGGRNLCASRSGVATALARRGSYRKVLACTPNTSSNEASTWSSSSTDCAFYNRVDELKDLDLLCQDPATSISLILGPRSAGKTALLKQYMDSRGLAGTMCYIDGRLESISTPGALAGVLQRSSLPSLAQQLFPSEEQKQGFIKALKQVAESVAEKVKIGGTEFSITGKAVSVLLGALDGDKEEEPLTAVIAAYKALLEIWKQRQGSVEDKRPPVLMLDEANVLMTWGQEFEGERRELLRFFVGISKQECSSHVVLATSAYAFEDWLKREIGPGFSETFVIGDFAQREAREFLDLCLSQLNRPGVADDDWCRVYEVCGGNPGAMRRAASSYKRLGSWELALSHVCKDIWSAMREGYRPRPGAGYKAKDYAAAVKAILGSPYNAVVVDTLEATLSSQQPEEVVKAMVRANLLALRPFSYWAKDIDPAAFGPDMDATVVAAPSAVELYLMQRKRDTLLAALSRDIKAVSRESIGDRPPSPTSEKIAAMEREVAEVKASVRDVEDRVSSLDQEMAKVIQEKLPGWQERLAYLQAREQRLSDKEKQLREELRQLQEMRLALMKREDRQ